MSPRTAVRILLIVGTAFGIIALIMGLGILNAHLMPTHPLASRVVSLNTVKAAVAMSMAFLIPGVSMWRAPWKVRRGTIRRP